MRAALFNAAGEVTALVVGKPVDIARQARAGGLTARLIPDTVLHPSDVPPADTLPLAIIEVEI